MIDSHFFGWGGPEIKADTKFQLCTMPGRKGPNQAKNVGFPQLKSDLFWVKPPK